MGKAEFHQRLDPIIEAPRSPEALALQWMTYPHIEVFPDSNPEAVVEKLKQFPSGLHVAVACRSLGGIEGTLQMTRLIQEAGYHAVPHGGSRYIASLEELQQFGSGMHALGIKDYFAIGGDPTEPAWQQQDSATALMKRLHSLGFVIPRIGVAGYPRKEHRAITPEKLAQAMHDKWEFAQAAHTDMYVVLQFCDSADIIMQYAKELYAQGITCPVYPSILGPMKRDSAIRALGKSGVSDAISYATKNPDAAAIIARSVITGHNPTGLIMDLADSAFSLKQHNISGIHVGTMNNLILFKKLRDELLQRFSGY